MAIPQGYISLNGGKKTMNVLLDCDLQEAAHGWQIEACRAAKRLTCERERAETYSKIVRTYILAGNLDRAREIVSEIPEWDTISVGVALAEVAVASKAKEDIERLIAIAYVMRDANWQAHFLTKAALAALR